MTITETNKSLFDPEVRAITDLHKEYFFLDNFFRQPRFQVMKWDRVWNCEYVEVAFQASKARSVSVFEAVMYLNDPCAAKLFGNLISLLPNWEDIKDSVMWDLLKTKFSPGSQLADQLAGTGMAEILEGNTWGDRCWGVTRPEAQELEDLEDGLEMQVHRLGWIGENRLGRMLMLQRHNLINNDSMEWGGQ